MTTNRTPSHGPGLVAVSAELRERVRRALAHGDAHARRELRTEGVEVLHRIAHLGLARAKVIARLTALLHLEAAA